MLSTYITSMAFNSDQDIYFHSNSDANSIPRSSIAMQVAYCAVEVTSENRQSICADSETKQSRNISPGGSLILPN